MKPIRVATLDFSTFLKPESHQLHPDSRSVIFYGKAFFEGTEPDCAIAAVFAFPNPLSSIPCCRIVFPESVKAKLIESGAREDEVEFDSVSLIGRSPIAFSEPRRPLIRKPDAEDLSEFARFLMGRETGFAGIVLNGPRPKLTRNEDKEIISVTFQGKAELKLFFLDETVNFVLQINRDAPPRLTFTDGPDFLSGDFGSTIKESFYRCLEAEMVLSPRMFSYLNSWSHAFRLFPRRPEHEPVLEAAA